MATIIPNTFTTYELTEEEVLQGQILTEVQLQVLQNERARLAEEKLAITVDADNITASAQEEAYKLGQLHMVAWLIECSTAANLELNNPNYINDIQED